MSFSLNELREKIDARNLRERSILFLCLLAVVFLLWTLLLQNRIDNEQRALNAQLNDLNTQRRTAEEQITGVAMALASDPNLEQKNLIAQLTNTINALDVQLGNLSQGLISADDLPRILQEMLAKTSTLELVRVQTLPVEELLLPDIRTTAQNTGANAGVFKHSVVLRLSGNYFQLLEYLQVLESAEWRFYWEQLDYRVKNYPNAEILLRVYTLGAEKGRLGV